MKPNMTGLNQTAFGPVRPERRLARRTCAPDVLRCFFASGHAQQCTREWGPVDNLSRGTARARRIEA